MWLGEWGKPAGATPLRRDPPTAGRSGIMPQGIEYPAFGVARSRPTGGLVRASPSRLPSFRVRWVSPGGLHLLVVRSRAAVLLEILQCFSAPAKRPRRRSSLPADASWPAVSCPSSAVVSRASEKESDASRLPPTGQLCDGLLMGMQKSCQDTSRSVGCPGREPGAAMPALWPPLRAKSAPRLPSPAAQEACVEGARG